MSCKSGIQMILSTSLYPCRNTQSINEHSFDILCLQECEIEAGFKKNILSFKNYQLELDNNTWESRLGMYKQQYHSFTLPGFRWSHLVSGEAQAE